MRLLLRYVCELKIATPTVSSRLAKILRQVRGLIGPDAFNEAALVRPLLPGYGVMVDVGAHMGETTLPFADMGWTIYAFEPDSVNREHLLEATASYRNVNVIAAAVSNYEGTTNLYRSTISSGISTLSAFHDSHWVADRVEVITLAEYLRKAAINHVDFLKIDVEGHDLFVLEGFPWNRVRPTAVLCEFEDKKTSPLHYDYQDLAKFLGDKGYAVIVSEWYPIEQYGTAHRWRCLHSYPCELVDESAWGNLIAVPPEWVGRILFRGRLMAWRLKLRQAAEMLRRSIHRFIHHPPERS